MIVSVHPAPDDLARATAAWLRERATAAAQRFAVCLAGGSTPRRVYELLASAERDRFPWDRVHWFFGDERFVPPDHPESNYRMAREALFAVAPVPTGNVHPIPTAGAPATAAQRYEDELKDFYGAAALDPQRPLFDVVLLGLGEDGHTASLFPGSAALQERRRWVVDALGPQSQPRITLTYPALASHHALAFLAVGAGKRAILRRVWGGDDLPAARLRAGAHWFIDAAADPRAG
ncbi:MAG TPA: 6-phosphogluconolactonase [Xanthobacteraceae bacterium]